MTARVDLFCRVIDNLGDIGVSWRLARQLQSQKACHVRLWVDRLESLQRLEPSINTRIDSQVCESIEICRWQERMTPDVFGHNMPDIVIAAFSCDLPNEYLERMPENPRVIWFALDYLSAESWVSDFHQQTSMRNDGLKPIYFFPGFFDGTGGLIREDGIQCAREQWCNDPHMARTWLTSLGLDSQRLEQSRLISVFNYASAPLEQMARALESLEQPSLLLIPEGVTTELDTIDPTVFKKVHWQHIPFLRQSDYDRLLWSMDLNLVRGEDSFVRAIWAGKPFIWNIYPQKEQAHHVKLQAWLKISGLPAPVCRAMVEWTQNKLGADWQNVLAQPTWDDWQQACLDHRKALLHEPDLATNLMQHWKQQT